MNAKAGQLVNVGIQNREAQSCGELLATPNVRLEYKAEREASQRVVVLEAGA